MRPSIKEIVDAYIKMYGKEPLVEDVESDEETEDADDEADEADKNEQGTETGEGAGSA